MTYKATILAAVLAAASLHLGGASANAAPVGPIQKAADTQRSDLQQVDWRPYRHCHRRHGRKWCHGGAANRGYGYYGYRPGVSLYIGPRYKHHRHYRRHHRH